MGIKHSISKTTGETGLASEWNDNHIIDGNVDYNQYQNTDFVIENRTDFPAGPVEGQVIFRTDLNKFYVWNGTGWATFVSPATIVVAADGTGHTTDIQTGIDLLPAGGGIVYIKEGIYTLTSEIIIGVNNTSLIGAGKSTEIRININENNIVATGLSGIHIEKVFCYGAGAGNGANNGIKFDGVTDSTITNCWVENCGSDGIYLVNSSNRNVISRNNVTSSVTYGIDVGGDENIISDNVSYSNNDAGVAITSGNYNILTGNLFYLNGWDGMNLNTHNSIISDNVCRENVRNGIYAAFVEKSIIVGNQCIDNDSGDTATYDGILLDIFCDNNIINNNNCWGNDRYQINISNANCDNNIVVGNRLDDGGAVGNLNDAGTGTEAAHNILT